MRPTIVLADDHPIIRLAIRQLLEEHSQYSVVGEASDGLETIRVVEELAPNVLVLDLTMPGLGGLDVLSILRHRAPRTRVVVFSVHTEDEYVTQALRNGALGYVVKTSDPSVLIEAIKRAASGRHYLGPPLSDRAMDTYWSIIEGAQSSPHDLLTAREREVLQLAAEGSTSAGISKRLSISVRTVEMHRSNAMKKLGLKTRSDLIRYAVRRGMISAGV